MDLTKLSDAELDELIAKTQKPTFGENLVKDVSETAKTLNPIAMARAGYGLGQKMGEDFSEGGIKGVYENTVKPMAVNAYKDVKKTVTHPMDSFAERPLTTAMTLTPVFGGIASLAKMGMKALPKTAEKEATKEMIDTAEVLPTKLEKTNIQNIAKNKFVQDNTKNFLGQQSAEIAKDAADATKQVKPAIREAQNQFYKNLGIKDTDPLDVNLARTKIDTILNEGKKTVDVQTLNKAKAIVGDIYNNDTNVSTFGKVKDATRLLYDIAEDNVNPLGRKTIAGKFFTQLGNALTEAKRLDPRIAQAGSQYSDLLKAEHLINKTMRLNREMGEMRLEGRIASSFKDKGQLTFKENLQKLEDTLKKYPETKDLVGYGGFTDKIKLAQLANDISTKKAVTPVGMGRIPGIKMLGNLVKVGDPEFQAQLLSRGIKSGRISGESIAGKTPLYEGLMLGKARTRSDALKSILDIKDLPSMPNIPTKTIGIAGLVNQSIQSNQGRK